MVVMNVVNMMRGDLDDLGFIYFRYNDSTYKCCQISDNAIFAASEWSSNPTELHIFTIDLYNFEIINDLYYLFDKNLRGVYNA